MNQGRSLRTAINLGFTTVVVLSTAVSIWTVVNLLDLESRLDVLRNREWQRGNRIAEMYAAVADHQVALYGYAGSSSASARAEVAEAEAQFYSALAETRTLVSPDLGPFVDSVGFAYRRFSALFAAVTAVEARRGVDRRADSMLLALQAERIAPQADAVVRQILALESRAHQQGVADIANVGHSARLMATLVAVASALLLLFSLLAGWKVIRTVLQPIRQLTDAVRQIGAGDLNQRVDPDNAGMELGELVRGFNDMVDRLRLHEETRVATIEEQARRFEQIVGDLSDAIIATDQRGIILHFNRRAELLFGLPAPLIVGRRLDELPQQNDVLRRLQTDIAAVADELRDDTVQMTIAGSEHSFVYEVKRLTDERGAWIGHLVRLQDVTRFRQVDDIRRKMISTVSHELRTPLTSIGMSLELLMEDGGVESMKPTQRELLDNIQEDVRRLQAFLADLLDLSRIELGRANFRLLPNSPRQLAEDAVRQIAPIAARQNVQIDYSGVSAGLPAVVADPNRVLQVFNNLLTNAIRYTPFGGTVSIWAVPAQGEIVFSIRDNGPGIPEEETERVFDRFYQIRDDQRAGGSGLGLAIVKEVVAAHGGRTWVESAVGRGSTFFFTLPITSSNHD